MNLDFKWSNRLRAASNCGPVPYTGSSVECMGIGRSSCLAMDTYIYIYNICISINQMRNICMCTYYIIILTNSIAY